MTMINTPLVLLAQQCGATFHTPGPMRAIRGMSFTFEQLEELAEKLRATPPTRTFAEWLAQAYRQPQDSYTVHNMEVAFFAGAAFAAKPDQLSAASGISDQDGE